MQLHYSVQRIPHKYCLWFKKKKKGRNDAMAIVSDKYLNGRNWINVMKLHKTRIVISAFLYSHMTGVSVQGLYKVNGWVLWSQFWKNRIVAFLRNTSDMNVPRFPTSPVGGNLVLLNLRHASPVFITTEHLLCCWILELQVHGANKNRVIFR